ncbi:Ku protein [Massilia sp. PWRC2]|uniref:non-homologous end joining protein Ku n=1 Tax=Massilia sp. PWRC2 TaxID=2804626 RepID=UPI003CF0F067
MARSLWKGAISFGLVHIPVEIVAATSAHALDLTMLDRRDFSPVGFKRYNKSTNKEVAWGDIVKGYEVSDGSYVVLSDEDLRAANPEKTGAIDIHAFVDGGAVPLLYYGTPYYLVPGKGGDKVYALLRATLRQTGKIAIATVVLRVKQHLAALLCIDDAIVLQTLRYADEIGATDALALPAAGSKKAALTDKEVKMAMALVEGMSEAWQPAHYHDSYREDVLALVQKKIKAKQTRTITAADTSAPAAPSGKVVDLVALLQQSLGKRPAAKAVRTRAPTTAALPNSAAPAPAKKSPARPASRRKVAA